MKRHVIYMDDDLWGQLVTRAKEDGTTVSATIRAHLTVGPGAYLPASRRPPTTDRFNTQPFRGPIPKKR